MWFQLLFMAKSPEASLTIRLTSTKEVNAPTIVRPRTNGRKRIYRNVEAVNFLLNSYATDAMMAKVALKIDSFRKFRSQMAVQFADVLKDMAL